MGVARRSANRSLGLFRAECARVVRPESAHAADERKPFSVPPFYPHHRCEKAPVRGLLYVSALLRTERLPRTERFADETPCGGPFTQRMAQRLLQMRRLVDGVPY